MALVRRTAALPLFVAIFALAADARESRRPHIEVRGIYGGEPAVLMKQDKGLAKAGVNAIWIGERGITKERVARLKAHGARIFAEFNTVHRAEYLKKHPDAAPVGPDGKRAEAPHGWQGICPTHEAYRKWRMGAFRTLLRDHEIDGVWLDYHHAHASWERAEPALPDTCFCPRCRQQFLRHTNGSGRATPDDPEWIRWRCEVFTDWVREFREILDETRPLALLGTFHCPWSDTERDGALRNKLAIDLKAQMRYLDVFSPMPYHARFGHAQDPAWISKQTTWLSKHLGITGEPGDPVRIWPIVQITDWGEPVPVEQIEAVLDHGTRPPARGVMVFRWGPLRKKPQKREALTRFYRAIKP